MLNIGVLTMELSYMVGMTYHRKNGAFEVGEAEKVYDMIW